MRIPFYKLQGTGNDFVAIDNRENLYTTDFLAKITPKLSDRRYGVGADGLLAISPAKDDNSDYTMIYLNADGSDAGMCGNGGRCIARLATQLGFSSEHRFNVHGFPYDVFVDGSDVTLHFPAEPSINTITDPYFEQIDIIYTGTEHICIRLKDSNLMENHNWIREKGKELRFDSRFNPKGTNVNFYTSIDEHTIKLVTYERGVEDITLSCGTGALAASICHKKVQSDKYITVNCIGGDLKTKFDFDKSSNTFKNLLLKGPAEIVFIGEIHI